MVVYEDGAAEPIRVFDHGVVYEDPETFGEHHLSYRTGDITSPKLDVAEPLAVEVADFVAAVTSGERRSGRGAPGAGRRADARGGRGLAGQRRHRGGAHGDAAQRRDAVGVTRPGRMLDSGTERSPSSVRDRSTPTPRAGANGAAGRRTLDAPATHERRRRFGRAWSPRDTAAATTTCAACSRSATRRRSRSRSCSPSASTVARSGRAISCSGSRSLPAWLVLFTLYGLYERDTKRISHSSVDDLPVVFHAVLVGSLLLWLYYRITAGGSDLFSTMVPFALAALVLVVSGRSTTRSISSRRLAPERVLLVGSNPSLVSLAKKMGPGSGLRLDVVGLLLGRETPADARSLPVLGRIATSDLRDVLLEPPDRAHRHGRRRRGRGPRAGGAAPVQGAAGQGEPPAGDVQRPGPGDRDRRRPRHHAARDQPPGPVAELADPEAVSRLGRLGRPADPALPRAAGRALAVRLDSRGPVLFRQERVGRGSRHFRVLKFRTMVADAEAQRAALLAQSADPGWLLLEHDPRVTRVGRFLRRTSIDELPQLLNVLRGQMSLVGPRPLIVSEDSQIGGWARGRLDLTPGITGLWQVLGRTSIPFEEMVKLDYLYVTNWSLWADIRLILRTLPAVLAHAERTDAPVRHRAQAWRRVRTCFATSLPRWCTRL